MLREEPLSARELDERYLSLRGEHSFMVVTRTRELGRIASRLPRLTPEVAQWFRDGLRDEAKKWFAAALAKRNSRAARELMPELVRAAMAHPDPSNNRYFVEGSRSFGWQWPAVAESMLRAADEGDPLLRGGVARASYWLWGELGPPPIEVRRVVNTWALRAFVDADDTRELRSLLGRDLFDHSLVEPEAHSLIDVARRKIAEHPDQTLRDLTRCW